MDRFLVIYLALSALSLCAMSLELKFNGDSRTAWWLLLPAGMALGLAHLVLLA